MRVKVEYIGHIRQLIGSGKEDEVDLPEGACLADLLTLLADKYGENFRKAVYEPGGADVTPNFMVLVNGYLINQLNGVKTKLKHGDHVVLTSVVSGG
ncbi:MoaD family protein [Candidatus Bathyarchaeota archaeon]|nr:MoaD family protein [Candidatus Bathyarchaeota archaeon]